MDTRERFYIDGDFVAPAGTATIDVISPHTEQVIGRVPDGTTADIDRAVAAARTAFDDGAWARATPAERSARISALSAAITARMKASPSSSAARTDRRTPSASWARCWPARWCWTTTPASRRATRSRSCDPG